MASRPEPRRRPSPSQLVLTLGLLFAALVAASWIAASLEGAHDPNAVPRPVVFDVPAPMEALFYTALIFLLVTVSWLFFVRVQNWERGQPDNRATTKANRARRIRNLRHGLE